MVGSQYVNVHNDPQERIHFWDEGVERLHPFLPRLYRVNQELFTKVTGVPLINYGAWSFHKWYTEEEVKEVSSYFPYVEYCERVRGKAATSCRSENSEFYLEPFNYEHYLTWVIFQIGR